MKKLFKINLMLVIGLCTSAAQVLTQIDGVGTVSLETEDNKSYMDIETFYVGLEKSAYNPGQSTDESSLVLEGNSAEGDTSDTYLPVNYTEMDSSSFGPTIKSMSMSYSSDSTGTLSNLTAGSLGGLYSPVFGDSYSGYGDFGTYAGFNLYNLSGSVFSLDNISQCSNGSSQPFFSVKDISLISDVVAITDNAGECRERINWKVETSENPEVFVDSFCECNKDIVKSNPKEKLTDFPSNKNEFLDEYDKFIPKLKAKKLNESLREVLSNAMYLDSIARKNPSTKDSVVGSCSFKIKEEISKELSSCLSGDVLKHFDELNESENEYANTMNSKGINSRIDYFFDKYENVNDSRGVSVYNGNANEFSAEEREGIMNLIVEPFFTNKVDKSLLNDKTYFDNLEDLVATSPLLRERFQRFGKSIRNKKEEEVMMTSGVFDPSSPLASEVSSDPDLKKAKMAKFAVHMYNDIILTYSNHKSSENAYQLQNDIEGKSGEDARRVLSSALDAFEQKHIRKMQDNCQKNISEIKNACSMVSMPFRDDENIDYKEFLTLHFPDGKFGSSELGIKEALFYCKGRDEGFIEASKFSESSLSDNNLDSDFSRESIVANTKVKSSTNPFRSSSRRSLLGNGNLSSSEIANSVISNSGAGIADQSGYIADGEAAFIADDSSIFEPLHQGISKFNASNANTGTSSYFDLPSNVSEAYIPPPEKIQEVKEEVEKSVVKTQAKIAAIEGDIEEGKEGPLTDELAQLREELAAYRNQIKELNNLEKLSEIKAKEIEEGTKISNESNKPKTTPSENKISFRPAQNSVKTSKSVSSTATARAPSSVNNRGVGAVTGTASFIPRSSGSGISLASRSLTPTFSADNYKEQLVGAIKKGQKTFIDPMTGKILRYEIINGAYVISETEEGPQIVPESDSFVGPQLPQEVVAKRGIASEDVTVEKNVEEVKGEGSFYNEFINESVKTEQ